jgi:hypothetical protein
MGFARKFADAFILIRLPANARLAMGNRLPDGPG